jgi:inhibitor of KinA
VQASFAPLGDSGVLTTFAREVDALNFAATVETARLPGVIDIVPAYVSTAVFFDLCQIRYDQLLPLLQRLSENMASSVSSSTGRRVEIPCCYELGPDLPQIAEQTGMSTEEVIQLHMGSEYTVYAIGFCPGFPYLGYLPEALCGVPRRQSPRLRVEPGSVGLTGRQTGIYPLERPGGWNLLGRTPLQLVDVADGYFPLCAGDQVRFQRIDESEFQRRLGQRL